MAPEPSPVFREPATRVKTKIMATLGPASESPATIRALLEAGADLFRLNMAHGTHAEHAEACRRVRQAEGAAGRSVAILADLGGPKVRLGPVPGGSMDLQTGRRVRILPPSSKGGDPSDLTAALPGLVEQMRPQDVVLIGDGAVSLRVEERLAEGVAASVIQGGEVRTGSGLNLPGASLDLDPLTAKDLGDLKWAASLDAGIDFIGLSFVRRATDVARAREELRRLNLEAAIVAKIERAEALEDLDAILSVSDGVMVARGDLGLEIDVARMASVQKDIIRRANAARVPVITATQMLESMKSSRLPTRAEATDVANAILDGSDALLLTGETAVGSHPVDVVAMMSRIAREAESLPEPAPPHGPGAAGGIGEPLASAAASLAGEIEARLLVVATRTGRAALRLSKQHGRTPIIAVSDQDRAVRRMCLYRGVTPLHVPGVREPAALLDHVVRWGEARGLLHTGDRLVILAGASWTSSGRDVILVHAL